VSLLPLDEEGVRSPHPPDHWLRRAQIETDADLLLTWRLRYSTAIEHEVSRYRYLASPLWIIPGPMFWGIPDHRYIADMTLSTEVFDISLCAKSEADRPHNLRRWYFGHSTTAHELVLNFLRRAGGSYFYHATSLLWPSTFLARDHKDLEGELRRTLIRELARNVANELSKRRIDLLRNERDYAFYLDQKKTRVSYVADDMVEVRWTLCHRVGALQRNSPNAPRRLRLFAGPEPEHDFERELSEKQLDAAHAPDPTRDEYATYTFTRTLHVDPGTTSVHLHVEVGMSALQRREFTIPLPPPGQS